MTESGKWDVALLRDEIMGCSSRVSTDPCRESPTKIWMSYCSIKALVGAPNK